MQHVKILLSLLTLSLFFGISLASAQIYKSVDQYGNVSYSDQPSQGAKVMDIKPINITPSEAAKSRNRQEQPASPEISEQPAPTATASQYSSLTITSPAEKAIIQNGLDGLTVNIRVKPQLAKDDQFKLLIDGTPRGLSVSNNFKLNRISRGQHKLQVVITNKQGKIVKRSPKVNIFVYWPKAK